MKTILKKREPDMRQRSKEMISIGIRFGIKPDFTVPEIELPEQSEDTNCFAGLCAPKKEEKKEVFVPENMMHTKTKMNHIRLI